MIRKITQVYFAIFLWASFGGWLVEARATEFVEGEVLVTFKEGSRLTTRARQSSYLSTVPGFVRIKKWLGERNYVPERFRNARGARGPELFDRMALVEVAAGDTLVVRDRFRQKALVKEARLNDVIKIGYVPSVERHQDKMVLTHPPPNDTDFQYQWPFHNVGAYYDGTSGVDIDARQAWSLHRGSRQIVVAVLDTGVEYTHSDLKDNMWVNPGEIVDGIDNDGNGFVDDIYGYDFYNDDADPLDDHFHGTHVAGTIAAATGNNHGVAGVNWRACIMALKFFSAQGTGTVVDGILAFQYAINNGAHVTNNSWSGFGTGPDELQEVLTEAWVNHNIVHAVAAGNDSHDALNNYPAYMDHVIAVSATDANDELASFSNFGEVIDVGAPGVAIYSTFLYDEFKLLSGTSMATPHVAGLAALMLSKNPTLTPDQIEQIIKDTADDIGALGEDDEFGDGRINVLQAILATPSVENVVRYEITSPEVSAMFSGENIAIKGTVEAPNLENYVLEYAFDFDDEWTLAAGGSTPVTNAIVGHFPDTLDLEEKEMTLRLTVHAGGDTYQTATRLKVDNINVQIERPQFPISGLDTVFELRGTVNVNHGTFSHYIVEYSEGAETPLSWNTDRILLTNSGLSEIENDILATFNVSGLNGDVTVRVTAYTLEGYDSTSHIFNVDPYLVPGWPAVTEGRGEYSSLTLAGGFSGNHIVVPSYKGMYYISEEGASIQHWALMEDGELPMRLGSSLAADDVRSNLPGPEVAFMHFYSPYNLVLSNFAFPFWDIDVTPLEAKSNNKSSTSPMYADLDNDGVRDIIFPKGHDNVSHAVNVVNHFGASLPGFPVEFETTTDYDEFVPMREGAVGERVPGGGKEIYITFEHRDNVGAPNGDGAQLIGLDASGNLLPGYPKDFYTENYGASLSNLVLADLNHDGEKELIFIETGRSIQSPWPYLYRLHVLDTEGNELPGFPYEVIGTQTSTSQVSCNGGIVAVGNVTGDSHLEIISSPSRCGLSNPGRRVFLIHSHEGELLGTPLSTETHFDENRRYDSPRGFSVVDFEGDGYDEIVMTTLKVNLDNYYDRSTVVVGYKFDETFLEWEVQPGVAPGGRVHPSGYPNSQALDFGDFNQNGWLDLVISYSGTHEQTNVQSHRVTYLWEFPYNYNENNLRWPTIQGNAQRTGVVE